MNTCKRCDNTTWGCEAHLNRPWGGISKHPTACHCGGAGAPCRSCCDLKPCNHDYVKVNTETEPPRRECLKCGEVPNECQHEYVALVRMPGSILGKKCSWCGDEQWPAQEECEQHSVVLNTQGPKFFYCYKCQEKWDYEPQEVEETIQIEGNGEGLGRLDMHFIAACPSLGSQMADEIELLRAKNSEWEACSAAWLRNNVEQMDEIQRLTKLAKQEFVDRTNAEHKLLIANEEIEYLRDEVRRLKFLLEREASASDDLEKEVERLRKELGRWE